MAVPAAWLMPWPSEPVMDSMPGECSAPIISTELPSLLNWRRPSSAMRPGLDQGGVQDERVLRRRKKEPVLVLSRAVKGAPVK